MLTATVAGNVTRDAKVREAGESSVCSFGVAHNDPGDKEKATFVDVSIWGKRGENIAPYIKRGDKIAVSGALSTREYDGKTHLEIRCDSVELCGGSGGKRDDEDHGRERDPDRRRDSRDEDRSRGRDEDRRKDDRADRGGGRW